MCLHQRSWRSCSRTQGLRGVTTIGHGSCHLEAESGRERGRRGGGGRRREERQGEVGRGGEGEAGDRGGGGSREDRQEKKKGRGREEAKETPREGF